MLVFVNFIGFMKHNSLDFLKINTIDEMFLDFGNWVYKNRPLLRVASQSGSTQF